MQKMVCESLDLTGDVRNRDKKLNRCGLKNTAKTQETDQSGRPPHGIHMDTAYYNECFP